jgi:hypothetical protein
MQVKNMTSLKSYNNIPNQFIIYDDNKTYFQSYKSIIVKIERLEDKVITYLDPIYYNYSRTTSKYRNAFLGESTKEIESKIKQGVYILENLN